MDVRVGFVVPVISLFVTACASTVIESSDTNGAGGSGGLLPAVAMTRAQWRVLADEVLGNHTGGGGEAPYGDPDDLFVEISDLGVSCHALRSELPCGVHWQLTLVIPPAIQEVGNYDLKDPLVEDSILESGPQRSAVSTDCSYTSWDLGSGTLEIVSMTAQEIDLVLSADLPPIIASDPSGVYVVPRCQ